MAAVALDNYSAPETQQLLVAHAHPGPWSVKWVPTPEQLRAYADVVREVQDGEATSPSVENVEMNL